jgi:hypothetical protein
VAVRILRGLRRGGPRFFVMHFSVDDRREAVLRVAPDVLPDVQHRSACRVDERAALRFQLRELADRHAEGGQDDDVVLPERRAIFAWIRQDADAARTELIVDVRVVDDLAGQENALVRKLLARLVRVVDRAIDAVAEAEFRREMDRQTAGLIDMPRVPNLIDDSAVVGGGQLGLNG